MVTIELSKDELNLLLSSVGLSLNALQADPDVRRQLEDLQTKLMEARDGT